MVGTVVANAAAEPAVLDPGGHPRELASSRMRTPPPPDHAAYRQPRQLAHPRRRSPARAGGNRQFGGPAGGVRQFVCVEQCLQAGTRHQPPPAPRQSLSHQDVEPEVEIEPTTYPLRVTPTFCCDLRRQPGPRPVLVTTLSAGTCTTETCGAKPSKAQSGKQRHGNARRRGPMAGFLGSLAWRTCQSWPPSRQNTRLGLAPSPPSSSRALDWCTLGWRLRGCGPVVERHRPRQAQHARGPLPGPGRLPQVCLGRRQQRYPGERRQDRECQSGGRHEVHRGRSGGHRSSPVRIRTAASATAGPTTISKASRAVSSRPP